MDDRIADALLSVWESFDQIIPHELWVITANALQDKTRKVQVSDSVLIPD